MSCRSFQEERGCFEVCAHASSARAHACSYTHACAHAHTCAHTHAHACACACVFSRAWSFLLSTLILFAHWHRIHSNSCAFFVFDSAKVTVPASAQPVEDLVHLLFLFILLYLFLLLTFVLKPSVFQGIRKGSKLARALEAAEQGVKPLGKSSSSAWPVRLFFSTLNLNSVVPRRLLVYA